MKNDTSHIIEAAEKGGVELARLFGEELQVNQKSMAADVTRY